MVRFLFGFALCLLGINSFAAAHNPDVAPLGGESRVANYFGVSDTQMAAWRADAAAADSADQKKYKSRSFWSAVGASVSAVAFAFSWFIEFPDRCPDGSAPVHSPSFSQSSQYVSRNGLCFDLDDATRAEVYSREDGGERLNFLRSVNATLVGGTSVVGTTSAVYALPATLGAITLGLLGYSVYSSRKASAPGRNVQLIERLVRGIEDLTRFFSGSSAKSTTL